MSIGSFSSSSGFAAAGVGLSFGGSFGDFRAIRALKQDWIFDAAFPTWGVRSFDFYLRCRDPLENNQLNFITVMIYDIREWLN